MKKDELFQALPEVFPNSENCALTIYCTHDGVYAT